MKIALDIMGGDAAPYSNILGAKLFIDETPNSDTKIIFVGPKSAIKKEMEKKSIDIRSDRFEIHHADDVILMDEVKPAYAFKNKPNSSMVQAVELVKENSADAIISAGNTAALLSTALFTLGKIQGIKRPALATYIPSKKGGFILCDVGANTDVKSLHLMQFAVMASDYVKSIDTYTPKTLTEADVKNIAKKPIVGGIFIAIGGGILISQNETEYEDIGNFEKFKTTTTIAYALITIGGVLIALGI